MARLSRVLAIFFVALAPFSCAHSKKSPGQIADRLALRLAREGKCSEEFFRELQAKESSGVARISNLLGVCYSEGVAGGKPDFKKAAEFYKKGAEMGDVRAEFNYGQALLAGEGTNKDLKQAKYWIERSAAQGEPWAHCVIYQNDWDEKNGLLHMTKAAEGNIPQAEIDLTRALLQQDDPCKNLEPARRWMNAARKQERTWDFSADLASLNRAQECCHAAKLPWPGNKSISQESLSPQLAEEYANGEGKPRNLDVALKIVCSGESMAEAEEEGMVDYILQMKKNPQLPPLHYCNFVTSGAGEALCAADAADQASAYDRDRIAKLSSGWPKSARGALERLERAADSFNEAESDLESDPYRGGSIEPSEQISSKSLLQKAFIHQLELFAKDEPKQAPPGELRKSVQKLNAIYREKLSKGDAESQNLLRTAQRKWIRYRDAWAKLYAALWSGKLDSQLAKERANYDVTLSRLASLRDVEVISSEGGRFR